PPTPCWPPGSTSSSSRNTRASGWRAWRRSPCEWDSSTPRPAIGSAAEWRSRITGDISLKSPTRWAEFVPAVVLSGTAQFGRGRRRTPRRYWVSDADSTRREPMKRISIAAATVGGVPSISGTRPGYTGRPLLRGVPTGMPLPAHWRAPMRILMVTVPYRAHLYGMAPLAWALRTAGHEVCVAGPPDIADDIAQIGLSGVSIGEPVSLRGKMAEVPLEAPMKLDGTAPADVGPCDPRGRREGRSVQSDYGWGDPYIELEDVIAGVSAVFFSPSAFDDLVDFARLWRPELVITDTSGFPGGVAAQVVGAAHARLTLSVDRMAQLRSACRDRLDSVGDPARTWLAPILERHGSEFDETVVLGHWTICATPPWIWQPQGPHYVPMRNVPFNGPAKTPRWVYERPERRRVCISQGISHRDATISGGSSSHDLLGAVADLDVEVIATLNA